MHKEIVPHCPILPTHGDMQQLEEELANGEIDAALVTLPVNNPHLCVEVIRRDRLVVCLRRDHPLAAKSIFQSFDLQNNLTILYHPERHYHAHQRARECLKEIGLPPLRGYLYARWSLRACICDEHRKDSINLCATVGTRSAGKVTKKGGNFWLEDKEYFQKNCSLLGTRSVSSASFRGG
jgi:hypothetical protein